MLDNTYVNCINCNNQCFLKLCKPKYLKEMPTKQYIVKKDEYLFKEGEPVTEMYFIQHGKVKVVSTGLDGKRQIVRLAGNGQIVGHRGYKNEIYSISAIALEESRVCSINNDTLYGIMKKNFDLVHNLMMFYSLELRKSELRAKCFAQMTVKEKVAYALLYIKETFGLNNDNSLNVAIYRKEIGEIAGTNDEQVSRALIELRKEKLIEISKRKIIINNYEKLKTSLDRYGILFEENNILSCF